MLIFAKRVVEKSSITCAEICERRVAQIITFGKLKAKSVVRDVGGDGVELSRCGSRCKDDPKRAEHHARFGVEKNPELNERWPRRRRPGSFLIMRKSWKLVAQRRRARRWSSDRGPRLSDYIRSAAT